MSDADRDEVVVSDGDLTVRKSIDADRFQTLAVVFDVTSDREQPTRMQLTDPIPEEVPMDDVGFHPEFGSEYWATEEHRVVFERTIDPGESYTTIYGVRDADEDAVDVLLGSPAIDIIDEDASTGPESVPNEIREIDDLISEERSDEVRDVISGESESLLGGEATDDAPEPEPESEPEPVTAPEADPAAADGAPDPTAPDEPLEVDGSPTDTADHTDDEEVTVPVTGGVARVLAKELREGTVSDADREAIREALAYSQGSTEARIRHLQSAVGDLEAYTDALEAFLDDEGGAEAVLGDVRDDVAAVRRDVRGVEDTVDGVVDRVDAIEETMTDIADAVDDLDDVGMRVGEVEGRVGDLRDEVDALRSDLDEMDEFRTRLSQAFDAGGDGEE